MASRTRLTVSPLERLRVRAGLTVQEVADRAGVDRKTVWNAEAGRVEPMMPAIRKLAVLYGVDPADLLEEIRAFRAEQAA
jgi:transcriptional regulator with XRE-family HTH domain